MRRTREIPGEIGVVPRHCCHAPLNEERGTGRSTATLVVLRGMISIARQHTDFVWVALLRLGERLCRPISRRAHKSPSRTRGRLPDGPTSSIRLVELRILWNRSINKQLITVALSFETVSADAMAWHSRRRRFEHIRWTVSRNSMARCLRAIIHPSWNRYLPRRRDDRADPPIDVFTDGATAVDPAASGYSPFANRPTSSSIGDAKNTRSAPSLFLTTGGIGPCRSMTLSGACFVLIHEHGRHDRRRNRNKASKSPPPCVD